MTIFLTTTDIETHSDRVGWPMRVDVDLKLVATQASEYDPHILAEMAKRMGEAAKAYVAELNEDRKA